MNFGDIFKPRNPIDSFKEAKERTNKGDYLGGMVSFSQGAAGGPVENFMSTGYNEKLAAEAGKEGGAAALSAQLLRGQWEDYKTRFRPVENALMAESTYNNPALRQQAIATGREHVTRSFDNAQAIDDRNLQRLGMKRSAEEQAAASRVGGVERSAAMVDAANRITQRLVDRDREIAAGGIPNAGRAYGLRSEN